MLKSRAIPAVILFACLAGFVFGVVELFQLRFSQGDIYPPYSTLRADPLGARALYESLQALPGLSVSRFYQPSAKLQGNPQRVLFVAGVEPEALQEMPEGDYKAIQSFLTRGGRIVVSLSPVLKHSTSTARSGNVSSRPEKKTSRGAPQSRDNTNDAVTLLAEVSFLQKNGTGLDYDDLAITETGESYPEKATLDSADATGLPDSISWHSAVYFNAMDADWQVLYRRKKHAVVIERSIGAGTLVLSADSYFLSNEALRGERHAGLLAWLVGPHREIIFDETHLGVEEHPGVATLLRHYRMEGVVFGLLLLAGLFIWKNSAPLVPPPADEAADSSGPLVRGRESTAGFASLLRRSVPSSDILLTCFTEWKAACSRSPRAAARLPEIERIVEEERSRSPGSRRPVETYQNIHRILTERK